jgi:hypothetical protein
MQNNLKTYVALIALSKALMFSSISVGQTAAIDPDFSAPNLVQVLPAKGFCTQIENTLTTQFNFKAKFATGRSATAIVDLIRSGKMTEYVPASLLNENNRDTDVWGKGQLLPLSQLLSSTLGVKSNVIVSFDNADLKHLPFVQQGTHIILITKSVAPLNAARAKAVAFSAKRLQIKISIIWLGEKGEDEVAIKDGSELAYIAATTDGMFVNLGGTQNPCTMTSH